MKKREALLSFFLSAAILIFSQPAFAVQNPSDESSQKSDVKGTLEILSQETQPLTQDDVLKNRKITKSDSREDSSFKSLIGKTKLEKDLTAKSNFASTAASGPDLAIGNLTVKSPATQPFSYTDYVSFEMLVANIGGQSISNVNVALFVDGTQMMVKNMGTFAPGFGGTLTIPIKGLCGTHQIVFKVVGSVAETNMDNNICGNNYTWKSVIDLAALAPEQVDDPMICMKESEIKVSIANYGNLPATNVLVNFELAGTDMGSTTIDLPAMYQKTLTLRVTFYACGPGLIGIKIDKNNTISDADRSNNYALKQFNITPEKDATIGKYDDATNIRVGMAPSTRDLLDGLGKHISFSEAKTAILKWNGITSKCKVGYVATVDSETPDDCDVVLTCVPGGEDEDVADTYYKTSGQYFVGGLRRLTLNAYYFNGSKSDFGKNEIKRTLTHETGHVFGLDHPTCNSQAIMQQSRLRQVGLASYIIESHDSANLKYLYS